MERLAILRYGDAEVPTIPEHQKVLARESAVWWGWWKKQTEVFPRDLLQYLKSSASKGPIRIGLAKRKEEESLHVATCDGVNFSDGSRIGSPEGNLTPAYYREEVCPAWFRFTQIQSVQRGPFLREFGFVPSSDPTLYEVSWDEENKFAIHPKTDWSMAVVQTPGDAILHLSDLHFGEDHGFPLTKGAVGTLDQRSLAEIICNRLTNELKIQIGVIVVSGDLITQGKGDGYVHARIFLDHLL